MDLCAEKFVDRLLTKEAEEQPSDSVKPNELVMELPKWFDEEKYNKGREFYYENRYSFSTSMLMGLVAVFAVPSILRILTSSRRSNSSYTAYKRYLSTMFHKESWYEHELKPGSVAWRSLYTVRSRHLRAGLASKAKGLGVVSQRDIALTMFGFVGFAILKPDKFGIRQMKPGDWEAHNHFWRVIGYMIGLEDKYNICRESIDETREVCQKLLDRVFTPCLENVPEYFEHMARVMLDGLWSANPTIEVHANLYWTRYLADVPGYIYTEEDRQSLQARLKKHLKGKSLDEGVDSSLLMEKPAVEGLPDLPPRLLYYHDFDTIETAPAFKELCLKARNKLFFNFASMLFYTSYVGRWYLNWNFSFSIFLLRYCPYLAFIRFGIKESFVNMFVEDPTDDTKPKSNAEYYIPQPPIPWYKSWLSLLW